MKKNIYTVNSNNRLLIIGLYIVEVIAVLWTTDQHQNCYLRERGGCMLLVVSGAPNGHSCWNKIFLIQVFCVPVELLVADQMGEAERQDEEGGPRY